MADEKVIATAVVEINPDTTKFAQKLTAQLAKVKASTAGVIKQEVAPDTAKFTKTLSGKLASIPATKIPITHDDIKLRQSTLRIANQYEKIAVSVRNMFAGIAAVGIGLGKTAISGFLKKDSVAAQELKFQLAELSGSWAKVGEKIATTKIGGKVLAEWVGVLADKLNKLKPETIERIVKSVLALATIAGLGTVLKVLNEFGDTLERIGILKDRRNLTQWKIDSRGGMGQGNGGVGIAANIASNLVGGVIGGQVAGRAAGKNIDWLIKKFNLAGGPSTPVVKPLASMANFAQSLINKVQSSVNKVASSSTQPIPTAKLATITQPPPPSNVGTALVKYGQYPNFDNMKPLYDNLASKISEVGKKADFKKTTQAIKGVDTNISRSIEDQLGETPIKLGKSINQMNKVGQSVGHRSMEAGGVNAGKAFIGGIMPAIGKVVGGLGLLGATIYGTIEAGKFLGQWLAGLSTQDTFMGMKNPFAIKQVPEGFKDQEEFDAYLNKGKKDRLSVSNAAIKGADSFLEEVNPIKENLNPKTQEELKKIFTGSEKQITSLNDALANIDRQIKASPNGNTYLEEQKGKLKGLLKSIYSEQTSTVKDYVRTLEEKKKLAEQEDDFQKSNLAITEDYLDKLVDIEISFMEKMKNLVFNKGEVGTTNDPALFLQESMKSFSQFGGDREEVMREKDKATKEANIEQNVRRNELEINRQKQLEDNTAAVGFLKTALEALAGKIDVLNTNVAPAY